MAFEVFLSTEEETDIFIANPHCNAISPSFEECIATAAITASTARFISSYSCGRTNYFTYDEELLAGKNKKASTKSCKADNYC